MTDEVQNEEVGISLQDIAACAQIIDLATSRGALRGEELTVVGGIRDKLVRFIKANTPDEEPEADAEETAASENVA